MAPGTPPHPTPTTTANSPPPIARDRQALAQTLLPSLDAGLLLRELCACLPQDPQSRHTLREAGTLGALGQPGAALGTRQQWHPQEPSRQAANSRGAQPLWPTRLQNHSPTWPWMVQDSSLQLPGAQAPTPPHSPSRGHTQLPNLFLI